MNQIELRSREREFLPLTDSLSSRVRWRICDYEAIVKAEIGLMLDGAGPENDDDHQTRSSLGREKHDVR